MRSCCLLSLGLISHIPASLLPPPQLRKSVCLALFKMWSDSELHSAMLEKACQDGDTTMAECLMELGADINAKTKSEPLVYQVRGCALCDLLMADTDFCSHV